MLCFLIIVILCVSGCKPIFDKKSDRKISNSEKIENSDIKIAIYHFSRDEFHEFLENPSKEHFNNINCNVYEYVRGKRFFANSGSQLFHINPDFVKFVNDKNLIKDLLLKHNISGDVEEVITFWPQSVPLTIWVKIDGKNVFIQPDYEYEEPLVYEYDVISYDDYYQKFYPQKATLNINGNTINTANNSIIYHNYCEVPFLATLETLGATYEWESDTKVKIIYNQNYYLDIKNYSLYSEQSNSSNLLIGVSGWTYFYAVEKDVMISDVLFRCVLEDMGKKVSIEMDKENNIILIKG